MKPSASFNRVAISSLRVLTVLLLAPVASHAADKEKAVTAVSLTPATSVATPAASVSQSTAAAPATAAPAAMSPAQQLAAMSSDALIVGALRSLELIDTGKFDTLWTSSAAVTQARFPKDAFAAQLESARKSVGPVAQRTWAGVARIKYLASPEKDAVPAGLYANVDFSTELSDGRVVFELVSLRIEDDGTLKFSGYNPRTAQGQPATVAATK